MPRVDRTIALSLVLALSGCEGCGGPDAPAPAPASALLEVVIDTRAPSRPISPYVYGINWRARMLAQSEACAGAEREPACLDDVEPPEGVYTLLRFGGTRTSTYNWENNASNAGHDPPANQNDGYLSTRTDPAGAVLEVLDRAQRIGAAALITVPMIGRVAADRRADGDVARTPGYLDARFHRSLPRGGRLPPDPNDHVVYQDAFVRFVRREAERRSVPVFFALDNEPSAWPVTQPRLREGRPLTYEELASTSIEYAAMITEEAPRSRVFGPVSFGWPAMMNLAGAPDADGRDFLAFYLARMRRAEDRYGRRLLHVLDVHWYPDVRVDGTPVTSGAGDEPRARLRMQLPRSLHDPEYREPSWIADDVFDGPVRLLPRLSSIIRRHYAGTRVAITEYAYGGAAHPSGAVAQADALGAFGRHGVFAAAYWPLTDQAHDYALAAFRMFRRVGGEVDFGDRSIPARSSAPSHLGAWASLDSEHPGRVVLVLVGRADGADTARVSVRGLDARVPARRFVLDRAAPEPRAEAPIRPSEPGVYVVPIPARSVTTLVIDPA